MGAFGTTSAFITWQSARLWKGHIRHFESAYVNVRTKQNGMRIKNLILECCDTTVCSGTCFRRQTGLIIGGPQIQTVLRMVLAMALAQALPAEGWVLLRAGHFVAQHKKIEN